MFPRSSTTPTEFTAYDHQADLILFGRHHCLLGQDVLFEFPTGGGKTLAGVTLLAMTVGAGKPFTHGIVAAPQTVIEDGFLLESERVVLVPSPDGPQRIEIDRDHFRSAGVQGSSTTAVLAYLANPSPGYVLTCTHAALVGAVKRIEDPARSFAGCLLFVDEAHHAAADMMGLTVDRWSRGGGRLVYATATPFRADGRPVAREGMATFKRTMPEQMDGGRFAPERLEHRFVPVGRKGDKVTKAEFAGKRISNESSIQDEIIRRMVQDWATLDYPKVVIRVPILGGGSAEFVGRLAAAFRAARHLDGSPCRVLDATGPGKRVQNEVIDTLKAERGRSFRESQVDVIIGIQRVREGLDWPHCSTVFSVGIPGSLQEVIQLLGRAMRLKGAEHPHRDCARIQFFVPCAGGHLGDLSRQHSRHALLTTIYLADFEAGERLTLTKIVRAAFRNLTGEPRPRNEDAPYHPEVQISPEVEAEVRAIMAAAFEAQPEESTPASLIAAVRERMPEVEAETLNVIACGILSVDPAHGGAVRDAIEEEASRLRRVQPVTNKAIRALFNRVVERFRDATLCPIRSLQVMGEQVHTLTGEGMREWVERFGDRAGRTEDHGQWDAEEMFEKAKAYYEREGVWPRKGDLVEGTTRLWDSFRAYALRVFGRKLNVLLDERFPELRRPNRFHSWGQWDLDEMARLASAYHLSHGEFPSANSGIIESLGRTWSAFASYLVSRDSSLYKFLNERFPEQRLYLFESMERLARDYFRRHGRWPTQNSGPFDSTGRTWKAFDLHLLTHHASSLKAFLDERFPELRGLPLPLIEQAAREHLRTHGGFPVTKSGYSKILLRTWSAADQYLRLHHRTSLRNFLDSRFPDLRGKKPA